MKKTIEGLNQEYAPQGQNFVTHLVLETNKVAEKDANKGYMYFVNECNKVLAIDRARLLLELHNKAMHSNDINVKLTADTIFEQQLKRWFY